MQVQYLLDHGRFAKPTVAMVKPDGLLILDGHHRLAAHHGLRKLPDAFFEKPNRKNPNLEQHMWMGTHREGELPLT
jgi:hypothetical protein